MINPNKLKTLVDAHASGPTGKPMPPADESDDPSEEEGEDDEPVDQAARGHALIQQWADFGAALMESADELIENAGEGTDEETVGDSVDRMPDDLQEGFAKFVAKLPEEDCEAVATVLAAESGADVHALCAYLLAAGKWAGENLDAGDAPEDGDTAEAGEPSADHAATETPVGLVE